MRQITIVLLTMIMTLGIVPTSYAETNTLQELIDQVPKGGEIKLEAETYEGNIVIKKPLKIIGQKGTMIKGDGTDNVIEIRSEEHTSELQSRGHLVCRLLLEKKK